MPVQIDEVFSEVGRSGEPATAAPAPPASDTGRDTADVRLLSEQLALLRERELRVRAD